jgi:hypothetical protein
MRLGYRLPKVATGATWSYLPLGTSAPQERNRREEMMNAQLCGGALAGVACLPLPIVDSDKINALDAEGKQVRRPPDEDLRCGIR